jgi:hypothetical protein
MTLRMWRMFVAPGFERRGGASLNRRSASMC